jgi:hypothetical protein
MANTRLSAFLSLLLVFVSGTVVGVVGDHVLNTKKRPTPEEIRNQHLQEMTKELHLDQQQVVALKQIYEETGANFDEARSRENAKLHAEGQIIHDQQVEKIKRLLRPEQVPLYDALRSRHEAERKKMQEQRHKGDIKKDQ